MNVGTKRHLQSRSEHLSKTRHGPLARTELGTYHVQGIDYAYTLQGWIKGVNSNLLNPINDIGHDAMPNNPNRYFARDAFGYTLGYYIGDSCYINDTITLQNQYEATLYGSDLKNRRQSLYNGNISHMVTTISEPVNYTVPTAFVFHPQGMAYQYDQLNRLRNSSAYQNLNINNRWQNNNLSPNSYRNDFTYDANGNILTQNRYDSIGTQFDSLIYRYQTLNGKRIRNRLYHLNDMDTSSVIAGELRDQGQFVSDSLLINSNNNYSYDEIGNLIKDKDSTARIYSIEWTLSGKVKKILCDTLSYKYNITFDYDPMGNRIAKHLYTTLNSWVSSEYYVRDAQGNIMATYIKKNNGESLSYKLLNREIYGSSRVGTNTDSLELVGYSASNTGYFKHNLRFKQYELSNHLGNVLSTITDCKIPVCSTSGDTISYFLPEVVSVTDYYPFGWPMPGRNFQSSKYRFAFNGQAKDDEVAGAGNQQDYGMRIYDPRVGKFLSLDPLTSKFPFYSPYQFAGDKPIWAIDLDGLEDVIYSKSLNGKTAGRLMLEVANKTTIVSNVMKEFKSQSKYDLYFYTYHQTSNVPVFDGVTLTFSSLDEIKKGGFYANPINLKDVEKTFSSGKKLVAIGINDAYDEAINDYYDSRGLGLEPEDRRSSLLKEGSFTFAHEIGAHLKALVESKNTSNDASHKSFQREGGNYSPGFEPALNDKEYKNTPANEAAREIDNIVDKIAK